VRKIIKTLALLSFAQGTMASEAAEHAINWWGLGSQYKDTPALGWLTLTFLLFIWLLVRTIRKPLSLYLETRSNDIKKAIEEGKQARLLGEKKLKLYEEKLTSLDQEIAKLKHSFMEQARAEKLEKERQAREMSERIFRDTKDTIKANFEKSKNRLAEELIKNALTEAQKSILEQERGPMDEYLKERLVSDLKTAAKDVPL